MKNNANTKKQFMQLIDPWCHRLFNIALRHCGDKVLAQDWSQETLLKAWKDFAQLQDHATIYAWLLKILNRVIADDIRRTSRRNQIAPVINVDDDNMTSHPCSAPGPFAQALAQQNQTQLQNAISHLPDEFKAVVLLRDIEGMSYLDIANTLELAKGTVMSRLSRGRRLLANYLLKSHHTHQYAQIKGES